MNRQQINTALTLRALGIAIELDSFDKRLIIQKAIYLAQAAGHDCGHFFRWYLRGPYSTELARDVFSIKANIDADLDDSSQWKLDDAVSERLKQVARLVPNAATAERARQLELLASVAYLIKQRQVPNADIAALTGLLKKYDKDYSESEVRAAVGELQGNGLLSR